MNYIIIGSILVFIMVLAYLVYRNKRHTSKISETADRIMSEYIAEGKDKYYKDLSTEDLLDMYKISLKSDLPKDTNEIACYGVEGKLMEDELVSRNIDVMAIVDETHKNG